MLGTFHQSDLGGGETCFVLHPLDPTETTFSFSLCAPQINCVTFPHPDTMPEQQLLKPTEWSYCDYFWVSAASVSSIHVTPTAAYTWEGWKGLFLLKPQGVVSGLASQTGTFLDSRSSQQSQGICVVLLHRNIETTTRVPGS